MKINYKTAFLILSGLLSLFLAICYFFNLTLVTGISGNYEFSAGQEPADMQLNEDIIKPKNIIYFIADGMGFSHLSLDLMLHQSEGKSIIWHEFDVKGWQDARSNYGPLTDSGASATALATGHSTSFETIGLDKDGNVLDNVLEIAKKSNYNTGIVTDSYIWDATPAAFVAHTDSRDNAADILNQIADSKLDLIFGELEDLGEDDIPELQPTLDIMSRRYTRLDQSLEVPEYESPLTPISAIYKEDQIQDLSSSPNLPTLTNIALDYLSQNDAPFILMVESEEMDAASHANNPGRVVKGLKALQETLRQILEFAEKDGETLVLFTSDHETGGLAANINFKDYPHLQINWTSMDHTAAVVPFFAKGPGSDQFTHIHRNWQIGQQLINLFNSTDKLRLQNHSE